jgi:hypothetical protein
VKSAQNARDAAFNRAATAPGLGLERQAAGPRASPIAPLNVAGDDDGPRQTVWHARPLHKQAVDLETILHLLHYYRLPG